MPVFLKILISLLVLIVIFFALRKISESERQIKKDFEFLQHTQAYKSKARLDALGSLRDNAKLYHLVKELAALPKDGTEKRNMQRSALKREILMRCNNNQIFDGCIILAEENYIEKAERLKI